MAKLWSGIDAGKAHHHCVVIDADGTRLLSQKIPNDEPALLELIADVLKLAGGDEVRIRKTYLPDHRSVKGNASACSTAAA